MDGGLRVGLGLGEPLAITRVQGSRRQVYPEDTNLPGIPETKRSGRHLVNSEHPLLL
jgi:hypothetical protein